MNESCNEPRSEASEEEAYGSERRAEGPGGKEEGCVRKAETDGGRVTSAGVSGGRLVIAYR